MKSLSVYIHIPFCVQKCRYCDFLSAPADEKLRRRYVDALKREIGTESKNYKDYRVQTIFIGGGTPTVLSGLTIAEILDTLKKHYTVSEDAEITVEMNPATADLEKLLQMKKAGVNRLSIGLQSAQNEELKMLGRIHTFEDFCDTYALARKAGFANINIDLMSALPGQSLATYQDTLEKVLSLEPEHISAYSLIIEENTHLYQNLASYPAIPSEEEDRDMYQYTKSRLELAGYARYEVSNYAKKGYACRHNMVYWQRGAYVGFGIGAASMVENTRWTNTSDLEEYFGTKDIKKEITRLSVNDCMEEFMFLGLRMTSGICKSKFQTLFGKDIQQVYGDVLKKWEQTDYLEEDDTYVRFTDKGIDVSNCILTDFLF